MICSACAILFSGCAGAHLSWEDIASGKLSENSCLEKSTDKVEQEECKIEIAAAKRAKSICEQEPYRKDYCYAMAKDSWKDFVFIMGNNLHIRPTRNFADTYPIMCWDKNGNVKPCEKNLQK